MSEITKMRILRSVAAWMINTMLIMAGIIFFYMAPKIDSMFFPVVSDFQITKIEPSEDGEFSMVWGVMTKNRGECRRNELNIFSGPSDENFPSKNYSMIPVEAVVVPNRPEGPQEWGPWKIYRPDYPVGPLINFRVTHRCNFMWETTTDLGSFLTLELFPNAEIRSN